MTYVTPFDSQKISWLATILLAALILTGCSNRGKATLLSIEASVISSKGHTDRAIELYTEAIALCPDNAELLCARGAQYRTKRDYERSIADYQEAIRVAPKAAQPHAALGYVYREQKNHAAAIASYTRAIELEPTAEDLRQRGIVYREIDELDSAIEDFSRAIALMPDDTTSYYQRSQCYQAMGDEAKAREDWAKSLLSREELRPRQPGEIRKGDWVIVTADSANVKAGKRVVATLRKGQRCLVKEATVSPVLFVETASEERGWLERRLVELGQ